MQSALEKILNLAKKTGDNVIVFNPAKPSDSYVILALNSYERLVNNGFNDDFLTEDMLDDKINPEIEDWAEANSWQDEDQDFLPEEVFGSAMAETGGEAEDDKEAMEDKWEEEVNYLYPTQEEISGLASEEILKRENGDFNSVADILEAKREQKNSWHIPPARQNQ
jgi:hypothetical protein